MNMLSGAIRTLAAHEDEVNDLNVFPIPDGDTGSNMLLTIRGAERVSWKDDEPVGDVADRVSREMLLAARGNSGVILSQFADGIAAGLKGLKEADGRAFASAVKTGVEHAYAAVMVPTEGTVLTVIREAADYASAFGEHGLDAFGSAFVEQARKTLAKTPELLAVLKKAGVVDSGGAGLLYIAEGMAAAYRGLDLPETGSLPDPEETLRSKSASSLDFDRFTSDSVLEFGYCTELLVRLQNAKTDPDNFDVGVIRNFLQTVGDSIVCFQTGSIVKIHVHTMTPYKVLEFCQKYGEYLTVKIENMTLQHNSLSPESHAASSGEKQKYAVVAVASGQGIQQTFREMGVTEIVSGGQSMNPSADDFLEAFRRVNAETVFVLPNNGNILLTARQAGKLYPASDVRVIETRNIGECYAVLSMLNLDAGDADEIEREMNEAKEGVVTASVSRCCRNTEKDGFLLRDGQYIGFVGDEVLSADNDRMDTACMLTDKLDLNDHEIVILIRGLDSEEREAEEIAEHIRKSSGNCEVYVQYGGQDIYSYILVAE